MHERDMKMNLTNELIALKEMNETRICLLIIIQSGMLLESILADLLKECIELCKIFQTSIRTTQGSTRPT